VFDDVASTIHESLEVGDGGEGAEGEEDHEHHHHHCHHHEGEQEQGGNHLERQQ